MFHLSPVVFLQMAAKIGDQPNMNSSSPVIDPSLYGFGGPKRSLDNGGKLSPCMHCGSANFLLYCILATLPEVVTWGAGQLHILFLQPAPMCIFVSLCQIFLQPSCKVQTELLSLPACCSFKERSLFCPNQSTWIGITTTTNKKKMQLLFVRAHIFVFFSL